MKYLGKLKDPKDLITKEYADVYGEYALAAFPTDVASGAIVSIPDGADNIPVKSMTVQITPVQSGSGDPAPDNVRPITGWTGANIKRWAINQWDEQWENGAYLNETGEKTTGNTVRNKNIIPVTPGATYYLHETAGTGGFRIYEYDKNKAFIQRENVTYNNTVTLTANTHFINFYIASGYGTTYLNDISINSPSTDTAYHAYAGTTYTVSWQDEAGTVYGGTAEYIGGGKWRITPRMAIVDLGTLTWTYNNLFRASFSEGKKPSSNANPPSAICEQYAPLAVNDYNSDNNVFMISQQGQLWINDTAYGSDANAFKAAVNGVHLVYELATPGTPFIVDGPDPVTLYGDNNVWADCGDLSVNYRADTGLYIQKLISNL